MKKRIIFFANTLWFLNNFKNFYINELSKKYIIKLLYLNKGNISENQKKIYKSNDINEISFKNIRNITSLINLNSNKSIIISHTLPCILLTPLLFHCSKDKIAVLEGLGRVFSSKRTRYYFLKNIVKYIYKILFFNYYSKIIVLNYSDYSYIINSNIAPLFKIAYLPGTGIDTNYFSKKNLSQIKNHQSKYKNKDMKTIAMISRLNIEKGFVTFLSSIEALKKYKPKLFKKLNKLLIVPKHDIDNLDIQLKKHISLLEIELLTYKNNPIDIYRDIDILIHPTNYYEGCSRVILEAGALQIPIIATKNRGIIDIIPNNNYGYILDNKSNPLEIIDYIEDIIKNSNNARKKSILLRKRIKERFDNKESFKTFKEICDL